MSATTVRVRRYLHITWSNGMSSNSPRWIVEVIDATGMPVWHCGHQHRSERAADKCRPQAEEVTA